MFVVISYDVVDDRRRKRVHDTLKDFGARVQYSVFECELDAVVLQRLVERLAAVVDVNEDGVRFYSLCQGDVRKIRVIGRGSVSRTEAFRMI